MLTKKEESFIGEYNKEYYDDRDIDPSESIFFKLTIIPFGEASSHNLKN